MYLVLRSYKRSLNSERAGIQCDNPIPGPIDIQIERLADCRNTRIKPVGRRGKFVTETGDIGHGRLQSNGPDLSDRERRSLWQGSSG